MRCAAIGVLILACSTWTQSVLGEQSNMVFTPEEVEGGVGSQAAAPPSEVLANALRLYQQEAYREAAVQFERVVSGQTRDDETNHDRAQFFLGKCLFHLGFYQSALSVFEEIVQEGPAHAYFESTLPWLANLSRELPEPAGIIELMGHYGDSLEVLRRFDTDETRDLYHDMLFMMGRHWYDHGEFVAARRFFVEVDEESHHFYPALFFAGITHVRERRAQPAVVIFRQVAEQLEGRFFLNERERRYRDLAWLSLARVYYSTGHWESAVASWNRITPTSEYWLDAIFEQSWSRFQTDQYDRALGNIHTINSPYFDEGAYPEVLILQAVIYFGNCHMRRAQASVARFNEFYQPIRRELETVVAETDEEGEIQAYFALARRLHNANSNVSISPEAARLLRNALSDRTLMRHMQYVELLDAEEARLEQMPPAFRNATVGARILQDVAAARAVAVSSAGFVARSRHTRFLDELQQLENQGLAIQIEVLDAERDRLVAGNDSVPHRTRPEISGDEEHIIWPFDGEYWRDELGSYLQPIVSSCPR